MLVLRCGGGAGRQVSSAKKTKIKKVVFCNRKKMKLRGGNIQALQASPGPTSGRRPKRGPAPRSRLTVAPSTGPTHSLLCCSALCGVRRVGVFLLGETADVVVDPSRTPLPAVLAAIEGAGFTAELLSSTGAGGAEILKRGAGGHRGAKQRVARRLGEAPAAVLGEALMLLLLMLHPPWPASSAPTLPLSQTHSHLARPCALQLRPRR